MKKEIEMKLYECLGVRMFQKAVFVLEKIVHYKDKKQNINYHFAKDERYDEFEKYLFYNATIHVRNIVLTVIYFIVKCLIFRLNYWDIIIVLLAVKDLYCIMLQRYNFLRIENYTNKKQCIIDKLIIKKAEKIHSENNYDLLYKKEDLNYINRLQETINSEQVIFIGKEDLDSIDRLYKLLDKGVL